LHGWVYDIKTGEVDAFDETQNAFVPVNVRYAAEIAELS
jgi:carbonic anhydrase